MAQRLLKMSDEEGPTPPRRPRLESQNISTNSSGASQLLDSITQIEDITYAGRIIRVQMENIMCHSNQEIRFNERINFICGNNGSGKSAILASIVVGLGEPASITGRFSSLKEMIKHGANNGRISIELMNRGCNEYQHDVYGDTITIVRSFTSAGSNSYQIKSSRGEVISRKKEELNRICEALNLSVRNPLCVLNQDMARAFLHHTDNKVRYQMFIKATGLEEIEQTHLQSSALLSSTVNSLREKRARLDSVEYEIRELRKKLEYAQVLNAIMKERTELEIELSWSLVIDQEKAIKSIKEENVTLKNNLLKMESDVKNHQTLVDGISKKREDLKKELQTVLEKKAEVARKSQEKLELLNSIRSELQGEAPSLNAVKNKLKANEEEISKLETFIAEMDERNKESAEEHKLNVERLEQVKKELTTNSSQASQAEHELESSQQSQQKLRNELEDVTDTIKNLKRNQIGKKRQLEVMKERDDTKLIIYGDYVPRLLEEIKMNRNNFEREPIGPLGMYIQLKGGAEWGAAVEAIIGGLMTAYCCHSDRDYRLLQDIMKRVMHDGRFPLVIISQFHSQRHDISKNIVRDNDPKCKPVLEMIDVTDTVTFNTLVDQASIESILLFEDDDCAAAKCTNRENVPLGLRMGITKGCDRYFPAPRYRTYAGQKNNRFFNHNQDKQQVIEKLTKDILAIEKEVESYVAEEATLRKKIQDFMAFILQTEKQIRHLRETKNRLEHDSRDLREKVESHRQPLTRVALEDELREAQKRKEACDKQIAAKEESIKVIKERKNTEQALLDEINEKRDMIQQDIDRLQEALEENDKKKKSVEFIRRHADKQMAEWKEKLVKSGENEIKNVVELEEALRYAKEMHPERIDTLRTPREITQLIEEKESYIKAASKVTGDPDKLASEFGEATRAFEEKRNIIKEYEKFRDFSRTAIQRRIELAKETRRLRGQEIGYFFTVAMKTRGFHGLVKLDYEENSLELDIQPTEAKPEARRTDVKTLSGGEKSYSTVSLILAIWRSTQMPFVAMDEFDVFMDVVNRKIVMDLLLQYAEETPNKQFIFLTPQDTSMVKQSDHCSVFQMVDHNKRPGEH